MCLLLCVVFAQGCRKQRPVFDTNLPPETYLSSMPLDDSFVFYRVKLYWAGIDPDGQIVGYYYYMTDTREAPTTNAWIWTTGTEAEFSLAADNPTSRGHTFYCKAVDDRGMEDPTPAVVYFYAHDPNRPKVRFTKAYAVTPGGDIQLLTAAGEHMMTDSIPGDTIPTNSLVYFAWMGWDEDPGGYITGYLYKLSTELQRRQGGIADTTFSTRLPNRGTYNFEVLAIDDAGALTNTVKGQSDTLRYFTVNYDPDTWIVPPCEGCPKGFFEGASIPRQEGDTLRLVDGLQAFIQWGGWDRDGYVVGWTHRLTREGAGPAYLNADAGTTTWTTPLQRTGDYEFIVRARDNEIKDDGTPARVKFYVNCAPFFDGEKRCCTCPEGVAETCTLPCTNTIVTLSDGTVYDSLYCAACDIESGSAAEYRTTLNGIIGAWRTSPIDILAKHGGLKTGLNSIRIEARDKQPDGSVGRAVSITREFYVDAIIL
jgi:hypothetical protein